MDNARRLESEWRMSFEKLRKGEFIAALLAGSLDPEYYKAYIGQTYFNASQNVKNMALFQAHLKTDQRQLEAKFLRHAALEVGHDDMALDDFAALGGDAAALKQSRPLPTTESLAAFIVFQIQYRNPLAYLGYLFHLEQLPIEIGAKALAGLDRIGIPASATTFLREHAEADPVHVKWNKEYLEGFIKTAEDFDSVIYGMRGTCELHAAMFQGVIESVRRSRSEKLAA